MTPRSPEQRLQDIIDYARVAMEKAEGHTLDQFRGDPFLRAGFERCVEVVGEAAVHVPTDIRNLIDGVPWQDIIGMRNILAHGYYRIDDDVLWRVVTSDLPDLIARV